MVRCTRAEYDYVVYDDDDVMNTTMTRFAIHHRVVRATIAAAAALLPR